MLMKHLSVLSVLLVFFLYGCGTALNPDHDIEERHKSKAKSMDNVTPGYDRELSPNQRAALKSLAENPSCDTECKRII